MNLEKIKEELTIGANCPSVKKDILIVVHDQYEYIKNCIESIRKNTENYHIYVWDNASKTETSNYLRSLTDITLVRNEENIGFIIPNNRLASMGDGDYIILLNSDTYVNPMWDNCMIGWLKEHNTALIGYSGGILNEEFKGTQTAYGNDIDYVCGWCMCFSRETYNKFGLFDEQNLKFAYAEDSDFSLRLREAGHDIYALNAQLVHHYGNATVTAVAKEGYNMSDSFSGNHKYIEKRWSSYLNRCRQTVCGVL